MQINNDDTTHKQDGPYYMLQYPYYFCTSSYDSLEYRIEAQKEMSMELQRRISSNPPKILQSRPTTNILGNLHKNLN